MNAATVVRRSGSLDAFGPVRWLLVGTRAQRIATVSILAALAVVLIWNASVYPARGGYDAQAHISYADSLVEHGQFPTSVGGTEYYTPPGFYALAGSLTWVGRKAGMTDPYKLGQLMDAVLVFLTALLVLGLARALLPGRVWAQVGALAFFSFLPVVIRMAAMFHPEPLDLFLTALSLLLCVRMLRKRSFGLGASVPLGIALGAGQLVRAFSLETFAVVLLTFAAAAFAGYVEWRPLAQSAVVIVVVAGVIAGPWYLHQATRYSNPIFNQPQQNVPLWRRRPLSFYVGLGLPQFFTSPARPNFANRALPTTYSEIWGDWQGYFVWDHSARPLKPPNKRLAAQNALGLLPTTLALLGAIALLFRKLRINALKRDPALLAIALMPVASILGYLYFTVSYPTPTGNMLKANYMLTAAPAWAICFGYALHWLRNRHLITRVVVGLLLISLAVDLTFIIHQR